MGELSSCFKSSFLNHSFYLNSILPAFFSVLGMSSVFISGEQLRTDEELGKERSRFSGAVIEKKSFVKDKFSGTQSNNNCAKDVKVSKGGVCRS